MKKKLALVVTGVLIMKVILFTETCPGQNQKAMVRKYLTDLPSGRPVNDGTLKRYLMTATYVNRDFDGNFTGKTRISGEYTKGSKDGRVKWNNVYLSGSNNYSEPFTVGTKQDFMEDFSYIPSGEMLNSEAFKDFPATPDNVFVRNLIWDMLTFDTYAWDFSDSLKLNVPFSIPGLDFQFDMAEIGKYTHNKILLCWSGISIINNEICSVIEFNATDNILEITMPGVRTKGAEQYWGTIWVSVSTREIEQAVMYSGTAQEVEVEAMNNKFLLKTSREIEVRRIY